MQRMIDRILEGNFDYEKGSLDFSCTKIEISLRQGEIYEGAFHVYAPQGQFANGTVIPSDLRMECLSEEFEGSDVEIPFCFHGENTEEGDVIKGNFYIISNRGEYYVPFVVSVEHTVPESSLGAVKNLFHFANLAKSNWQEAVNLFYSPEFVRILTGSEAQFAEDYRALSVYEGREQNMEEFLIRIGRKQKVEYVVQESLSIDILSLEGLLGVTEYGLDIARKGWGFTRLIVECAGGFVFTEKEVITDDDFLGEHFVLPVFVDGNLCRRGRNFGQILLYNSYVSMTVPVTVRKGDPAGMGGSDLGKKRSTVELMEFYQAFRAKKIGTATWLKESGKLVEKMVSVDENDVAARLFQAQLLITGDRCNEAGWILDHVAELLEKNPGQDTLLAYYLYLTTLIHRETEYVDHVAAEVEHIYRMDDTNWRAAWLLLYLSEELHKSAAGKWMFLEKQYIVGCCSPILYIEAVTLLNYNPALLRRLGDFEQQVLWYGVRQELLKQDVVEQLLYLADRVREYSGVLCRLLIRLYEKKEDQRVLQQICALLIKGGKAGEKYFAWYSAGVKSNLRITNLYEYYMASLNLDQPVEIPKMVLMYFSYQNKLDYEHCAYLFDYICKNRNRLGDIYGAYRIRMEHFVAEQIRKGRIDRHLANLYNHFLQPDLIKEENAPQLSRLLFTHMIRVEDDRLRKVYVYQPGNLFPGEYVLDRGRAWVSLYGSRYTIVFEDAWNNRFVRSVEYTMEKLMIPGKFLRFLVPFVRDCPELELYLCEGERENAIDNPEGAHRALRVAASGYADSKVKRELSLKLMQYYQDMEDFQAMDKFLPYIPLEEFTVGERGEAVRFLILRGYFELAGEWLRQYGPYFVEPKLLVRLIGPLMEQSAMAEDPVLTAAAVYAFRRGKYDGIVLQYLAMHYRGMTRNMRDIWKAAMSYGVDCRRLCGTILAQMLYTGAFVGEKMEIFRCYVSMGSDPELEEAFLAQCCFDYFVKERVTEGDVFQQIQDMYLRGEPVQKVCKLAFLKFCGEDPGGMTEDMAAPAECFLQEMLEQGIHLDFFRAFRRPVLGLQELADKTIVEYHASFGNRARIHYVIFHENGESEEYASEYMREVYGGVCFKEFILFFGESLQYYITEEKNGVERLTESGSLQKSEDKCAEHSRYHLINDIIASKAMQDYHRMDVLLEEYHRNDFMNGRLFELV